MNFSLYFFSSLASPPFFSRFSQHSLTQLDHYAARDIKFLRTDLWSEAGRRSLNCESSLSSQWHFGTSLCVVSYLTLSRTHRNAIGRRASRGRRIYLSCMSRRLMLRRVCVWASSIQRSSKIYWPQTLNLSLQFLSFSLSPASFARLHLAQLFFFGSLCAPTW